MYQTCWHSLIDRYYIISIIQSEYEWAVLLYLPIRWVRQIVRPKMSNQQGSYVIFQVKVIVT